MNSAITDMFKQADGRYLTKDEGQLLREFASTLEARLAAMEELSQKEGKIIDRAIKEVMRAYPDYKDKYPEGQQKGARDMTFVLRYCAHAMVRNDPRFLEDTVLAWLATILRGVGLRANLIADAYRAVEKFALEELSPPSAELIRPWIQMATGALSAPPRGAN
ncbi:MAG: hypothetical protein SFW67_13085 [Myxococcaceae bacterium]|nr:hypothetical protein [Myxococcaceae bacterium]